MASLIAPGMWIAPVEPLPFLAWVGLSVNIEDKPYFCVELDLLSEVRANHYRCDVCGNGELYLKVREFPAYCFCPTHWRPLLSPKAGAFDSLLAPKPSLHKALEEV